MSVRGNSALKAFDRIVGIPVIRVLGLLPQRARPSTLERVGVLRTAAIGDTLLLAGTLRDLAAAFPAARVTLITGVDNAEAGALASAGSTDHFSISVCQPLASIAALRRCRFDVLIDTGAWPRADAVFTALSGARYRVGFRTPGQHRHYAYDLTVDHSAHRHEIDNFRALAAALGVSSVSQPLLRLDTLPQARNVPPKPFLVLHPWSAGYRGKLKEWPTDRWVALAERTRPNVASVVVTGGQAQRQASASLATAISRHGIPSTERVEGLPALAALLRESAAVVSVNTGVMHLSAQLGVPTVSLDGPTPPSRWGPVGPHTRSVVSDLPGCGYLNLGFEYAGRRTDCMLGVSVDAVARALGELTGWKITPNGA